MIQYSVKKLQLKLFIYDKYNKNKGGMKLKKILLLLFLILSVFSCRKKENPDTSANKEETVKNEKVEETEKTKEKSVEEQIKEMVNIWNEASSNADFETLEKILGDKIEYYQSSVTKAYYISDQKKFFEKNPVYGQKIKGDITVTQISNKQVKAEFIKEVTTKKGTKDYPSYLIFANVNGEWKLILESDKVSDANAENQKKRAAENPNKSKYKYEEPVTIVGTFGIKKVETENGIAKPYVITLNTPIKVVADEGDDVNETETNQNMIQLALTDEHINYLKSKNAYGKWIQITGTFYHSHTMYHYTPVLMSVSEVKILN